MDWLVDSYQAVVFHNPTHAEDAFQVWLAMFKTTPDNFQRNPDPALKTTQAYGVIEGFPWQVICAPGRIDVYITGGGPGPTNQPFPTIANDELARVLLASKIPMIDLTKLGIYRLAFVSVLSWDQESRAAANAQFAKLAGVANVPDTATDLVFSMNIRKVQPSGYEVNRLCNWQAFEKTAIQVMQGHGETFPNFPHTILQPSVILNIDINTVPQQVPTQALIQPETVSVIFNEMIAESTKIRIGGYDELHG